MQNLLFQFFVIVFGGLNLFDMMKIIFLLLVLVLDLVLYGVKKIHFSDRILWFVNFLFPVGLLGMTFHGSAAEFSSWSPDRYSLGYTVLISFCSMSSLMEDWISFFFWFRVRILLTFIVFEAVSSNLRFIRSFFEDKDPYAHWIFSFHSYSGLNFGTF